MNRSTVNSEVSVHRIKRSTPKLFQNRFIQSKTRLSHSDQSKVQCTDLKSLVKKEKNSRSAQMSPWEIHGLLKSTCQTTHCRLIQSSQHRNTPIYHRTSSTTNSSSMLKKIQFKLRKWTKFQFRQTLSNKAQYTFNNSSRSRHFRLQQQSKSMCQPHSSLMQGVIRPKQVGHEWYLISSGKV